MSYPRKRIQNKLILSLGGLFVLMFTAILLIDIFGLPLLNHKGRIDILKDSAKRTVTRLADHKKSHILKWLGELQNNIKIFASNKLVIENTAELVNKLTSLDTATLADIEVHQALRRYPEYAVLFDYLRNIFNTLPYLKGLHITDAASGRFLVASYDPQRKENVSYFAHTRNAELITGSFIEPVMRGHHSKNPVFHISFPIIDNKGKTLALLQAGLNTNDVFMPMLNTGSILGDSSEILLLNEEGYFITDGLAVTSQQLDRRHKALETKPPKKLIQLALSRNDGMIETIDGTGLPVIAAYRYLPVTDSWGWGLIVKSNKSELLQPLYSNLTISVFLGITAILLSIYITIQLTRRFSRPLEILTETARQVSGGDLKKRADITTNDEIGSLAESFNHMIDSLERSNYGLEQRVEERTTQLKQTNLQLQEEVKHHQQTASELQKIRINLEKLVSERTRNLSDSNRKLEDKIAENKVAVDALLESEEKYRNFFEDSIDAIYITSRQGIILDCNPSARKIFGYNTQTMIGMQFSELFFDNSDVQNIQLRLEKYGSVSNLAVTMLQQNGTRIDCLLSTTARHTSDGTVIGYQGIIRDITQYRRLEQQLLQDQKTKALGTLASGIAHDFNNILVPIFGNLNIVKHRAKEDHQLQPALDRIHQAALRARDLVRQILTFSRDQTQERTLQPITPIIAESIEHLKSSLTPAIELKTEFAATDATVLANSTQIHQLIMNLGINAIHAMEKDGGTLKILLQNFHAPQQLTRKGTALVTGDYLHISIQDSGCGIAPELLQRVFEPYFTTKQDDKGTGMGLAIVHSVVQHHEGIIEVTSSPGTGTCFDIYLPTTLQSEFPTMAPNG